MRAGADVLADHVRDERDAQRRGVVLGPGHDDRPHERPRDGDHHEQDAGGQEREEQDEPEDPGEAAAAARRSARTCAGRRDRGRSGRSAGSRCGTRHRTESRGPRPPLMLIGPPSALDGPTARRASSSSWRMTLAASRSIRARNALRWVRDGGPPERPRGIRPSRRSASNEDRRSSRSVTGSASRSPIAAAHSRAAAAIVPSPPAASTGRPITSSVTSCSRHTPAERLGVGVERRAPVDGRQRAGDADPGVRDGEPDPLRSEVDPQDARHAARPGAAQEACGGRVVDGWSISRMVAARPIPRPCRTPRAARNRRRSRHPARPWRRARSSGAGSASGSRHPGPPRAPRPPSRGRRWSGRSSRSPATGRSRRRRTRPGPPRASAFDSPRTPRSSAAASSGRTCFALPSTGNVMTPPTTVPSPMSIVVLPSTSS